MFKLSRQTFQISRHTLWDTLLYGDEMIKVNYQKVQLQGYLAESQLRFDLDPFEGKGE